jgi:hypothetical protein
MHGADRSAVSVSVSGLAHVRVCCCGDLALGAHGLYTFIISTGIIGTVDAHGLLYILRFFTLSAG